MKFILQILLLALVSPSAPADTLKPDHLRFLRNIENTEHYFCNLVEVWAKLPQTKTSCGVLMQVADTPEVLEAIARGEFGQVMDTIKFEHNRATVPKWIYDERFVGVEGQTITIDLPPNSRILVLISQITVEQLKSLRYDPRIYLMAMGDMPVGPNGGISSAGGSGK